MNSQMERYRGHVKSLRHRGLCPHRIGVHTLLAHGCSTQKLSEPCPFSGFYGGFNGSPLQYFCLENPMDGGAWWAAVHGVAKSRTQLSDFTFTFHFHAVGKEMATHSSVLAWRIPGTAEPGGLPSVGSHRVGRLSSSSVYTSVLLSQFISPSTALPVSRCPFPMCDHFFKLCLCYVEVSDILQSKIKSIVILIFQPMFKG